MEGQANLASRSAPEPYHAKVAGSSPPPPAFRTRLDPPRHTTERPGGEAHLAVVNFTLATGVR